MLHIILSTEVLVVDVFLCDSLVLWRNLCKGADPTLMTRNNLSAVDLARPRGGQGKAVGFNAHHEAPLPWLQLSHHLFLSSLQAKRIRCPCKTLAAVRVEAG